MESFVACDLCTKNVEMSDLRGLMCKSKTRCDLCSTLVHNYAASFCEVQLSIKKASQLARIKLNTVHTTQSFIFLTILLVHRPGFLDSFEVL